MVEWLRDRETTVWLGRPGMAWPRATLASQRRWVRRHLAEPSVALFGIRCQSDRRLIGTLKLTRYSRRGAELGLLIGEAGHRGRGLGAAVIRRAAQWAREKLGVAYVTAGVRAPNTASLRAFLKAGFRVSAPDPVRLVCAD